MTVRHLVVLIARRQRRSPGYSIVELLVVAVFGVVLLGAVAVFSLSQLRSDANLDVSLQLRREANRAANWIDSEITRASGFDNTQATNCAAPGGTSLIFSLRALTAAGGIVRVSFYSPTGAAVGPVVRCGPPVVCTNGTACALNDAGAATTYLIASNARLSVNPAATATPVRALTYTVAVARNVGQPAITSTIIRQAFAGTPAYN